MQKMFKKLAFLLIPMAMLAMGPMAAFLPPVHAEAAEEAEDGLREYTVMITTSNAYDGGTDSDVYIQFEGEEGTTSELYLDGNGNDFENGDADTYTVKDIDVGTVTRITLRLDGGDAWRVNTLDFEGRRYDIFQELENSSYSFNVYDTGGRKLATKTYTFGIETAGSTNSGTDSDVWVGFIGTKGSTGRYLVETSGYNDFEAGDDAEYEFTALDVGEITQAVITLDGGDAWKIASITMDNGVKYSIFQELKNPHDTVTVPITSSGEKESRTYSFMIGTMDETNAGTDSPIYIQFNGTEGSTGYYLLDNDGNDFEKGNFDEYEISAVDIGEIESVDLFNEGSDEWYAGYFSMDDQDYVVKKKLMQSSCNIPLTKGNTTYLYRFRIHTADKADAGTDSNISIQLEGTKGKTGYMTLDLSNHNDFERDSLDDYILEGRTAIGTIKKMSIKKDNANASPDWALDYIIYNGKKYNFQCRWFTAGTHTFEVNSKGKILSWPDNKESYYFRIHTADISGAGTDSNIYIKLIGANGSTDFMHLTDSGTGNQCERDDTEYYVLTGKQNIGKIKKIQIKKDTAGAGEAWALDYIYLYNKKQNYKFRNQWFEGKKIWTFKVSTSGKVTYESSKKW